MSTLSVTYKCCGRTYSSDSRLFAGPAETIRSLDRLHAEYNPGCPKIKTMPITGVSDDRSSS